jgi:hypothetical protein
VLVFRVRVQDFGKYVNSKYWTLNPEP